MASRKDIEAGRAHVVLSLQNNVQKGLVRASAQLAAFGRSVKAIGADMAGVGRSMIGFGAAAAAPMGLSVKRFADFDDAMRAVQAVSQSTDQEFSRLTETAKKLGASTSFTAVEVANLMTELGRAGFTADQIEAMTGAVLNLARATGTDATVSAGIMAASIRQFGMQATDATRVADALTVAANKSFNSVESLGEALSYAGPVASDFGMSIEDTLAILGGLGNVGIQGSEAGTAMRRLLTLTGAEAEKLQNIFGVSFRDAAGNARPLVDVLEEVNQATQNLGSGERATKFNEAFGLLGITSASAIGRNVGSIRELRAALEDAGGAAETAAKKMDAGLGGSFRILMSAIEGVAIGLGEALAPAIQKIADRATLIAGAILDWVKANREVVVTIAGLTAGVIAGGAALVVFGGALSVVGSLAAGAGVALGAVASIAGFLASPIGLVAAGLVAIGAAFTYVSGSGSYFAHQVGVAWEALKGITQFLVAGEWSKAWDLAKLSLATLGSAVVDLFGQMPQFLGYAIGRISRAVVDGFIGLQAWINRSFARMFTAILESSSGFALKLAKAMMIGDVSGLAKAIAEPLNSAMQALIKEGSAIGAGWNKEGAPTFQASDSTKSLQAQMAAMMASGVRQPTAATGAGGGTPAISRGGMQPSAAGGGGALGIDIAKIREELNLTQTPLQKFSERAKQLHEALAAGAISAIEFSSELKAARSEIVDSTPIEKYTERIRELQELLSAGLIDEKAFRARAMEALPDRVKEIIDNAKTPLQKLNEQLAEARGYLESGLITREQFAAEQARLSGVTLPKVSTSVEGTFSAAAAMASMGARVGRPEEATAQNTAAMRRALDRLIVITRRQEGLVFS